MVNSRVAAQPERRASPIRRQANECFEGPDGKFSILKAIAVFSQISALYQFNVWFDALIVNSLTMLVVMSFIIAPHLIVRLAGQRLGGMPDAKAK